MAQMAAPRRSQLLEALLAQQLQRPDQIRSAPELGLRLLAAKLRQGDIDKLRGQEAQEQENLARVLRGAQEATESSVPLLDVEGGPSQVIDTSRRGINLTPQQQVELAQIRQIKKEAADPSPFEQQRELQRVDQEGRAEDREARREIAELDRASKERVAELNRLHDEDAQIRDIQARVELERIKNQAKAGGIDLSEREGKATAWLNQIETGIGLINEMFDNGYEINEKDIVAFSKAIDDETGALNRRVMRNLMSQEAINFFDAAYAIIDPVVRQSTGAAVKPFEFHNWFNTLIPLSNDPTERTQKQFMRDRLSAGIAAEAGPGVELVRQIHQAIPQPDAIETVTIGGNTYEVGQEVTGAGGRRGIVNADGTITPIE